MYNSNNKETENIPDSSYIYFLNNRIKKQIIKK